MANLKEGFKYVYSFHLIYNVVAGCLWSYGLVQYP